MCWSLYVSLMANPFIQDHVNFDEFMKRYSTPQNTEQVQAKTEQPLNVQAEVAKANSVLKNFKPIKKKGGAKRGNRSV